MLHATIFRSRARDLAVTLVGCAIVISVTSSCAPRGPVLGTGEATTNLSGTISGIVRAAGSNSPLSARKVIAINVATDGRFEASTGLNGGYTIKVPVGEYRLEVELRNGESVAEGPEPIEINDSDLDASRDFVISATPNRSRIS